MIKSALRAEIYQIFSNLSKLLGLYINNLWFAGFGQICEIFFDNPLRHGKMWASSLLLIWLNRGFLAVRRLNIILTLSPLFCHHPWWLRWISITACKCCIAIGYPLVYALFFSLIQLLTRQPFTWCHALDSLECPEERGLIGETGLFAHCWDFLVWGLQ